MWSQCRFVHVFLALRGQDNPQIGSWMAWQPHARLHVGKCFLSRSLGVELREKIVCENNKNCSICRILEGVSPTFPASFDPERQAGFLASPSIIPTLSARPRRLGRCSAVRNSPEMPVEMAIQSDLSSRTSLISDGTSQDGYMEGVVAVWGRDDRKTTPPPPAFWGRY